MQGSLVGPMKVVAAGLAFASLLCWVPGSQAAVHTGSATDPAGDMGLEQGDNKPAAEMDFTSVAVKYDDVAGRVDVSYVFAEVPQDQDLRAGVSLGSIQPDGGCSAPSVANLDFRPGFDPHGEAALVGHSSSSMDDDVSGSVWTGLTPGGEVIEKPLDGDAFFEWPGSSQTWNFATTSPWLVGRHYTCARPAMWVFDGPSGPGNTGAGSDYIQDEFFALNPDALPVSIPTVPSTEPLSDPPSASTGSQPDKPAPRFTASKARKTLTKALARRYDNAFLKRTDFTSSCVKPSPSRWDCVVRWTYGRSVYKGKLTMTIRSNGRVVSRAAVRKLIIK